MKSLLSNSVEFEPPVSLITPPDIIQCSSLAAIPSRLNSCVTCDCLSHSFKGTVARIGDKLLVIQLYMACHILIPCRFGDRTFIKRHTLDVLFPTQIQVMYTHDIHSYEALRQMTC